MILAALWANSNYDQKENIRPELSASIDELYGAAIDSLYDRGDMTNENNLPDTAFFRASVDWKGPKSDKPDEIKPDDNLLDVTIPDNLRRYLETEEDE